MSTIPTPAEPSNSLTADVTRRIVNLLWQRGGPWLATVDVRFDRGTATLSGKIRSFHERQLCIVCCQHVPGVHQVVDELKVDYATAVVIASAESGGDCGGLGYDE